MVAVIGHPHRAGHLASSGAPANGRIAIAGHLPLVKLTLPFDSAQFLDLELDIGTERLDLHLDLTAAAGQLAFTPFDLLPSLRACGQIFRLLYLLRGAGEYALRADIDGLQAMPPSVRRNSRTWLECAMPRDLRR